MKDCENCIHFEVCAYVSPFLSACDDFKDRNKFLELPCPIGTDLYRIDSRYKTCSFSGTHKDEWYCMNVLNCHEECDSCKEYYIYEIKNADAMAILGNAKYFGTRVFLTREEAEKKLEELK